MANAFANVLKNNAYDRNFGGTGGDVVADPYISGYHYIRWTWIPKKLGNVINDGGGGTIHAVNQGLNNVENIKKFLQGACLAVTPPGGTLNKTEFTGIGGMKWAVPTNIDYTNQLTIKFLEFHHLPVLTIFRSWVRMIRDFKSGTSHLWSNEDHYSKENYAGTLFYWTTKPDGKTVEYSACYTGVFPTKDPQDLYSGDLTAVDKLEVDIEFSIDMAYHEKWVYTKCQGFANTIYAANHPFNGSYYKARASKDGAENAQ